MIPVGTSTAEPGDASASVGMVWVTYTAMVALVCLGGAVALFRARERLGTALVAVAAPLSLLTPLVWVVALLALAAALWAWFDLRRRRFEHVRR